LHYAEVRVVYNGPDALEVLETYDPGVMLLDIGMPGMDGLEVARRVRQRNGCQDITLIALTGWGQKEDLDNTQAAGFDHHLTKPVDVEALTKLLFSVKSSSVAGRPFLRPKIDFGRSSNTRIA
jgi:CheY-like chemotaxis protein